MRKLIGLIAIVTLLVTLAFPLAVDAQVGPKDYCIIKHDLTDVPACPGACSTVGKQCDKNATENWGLCCVLDTIYTVTDWVFYILLIVSVLMIVAGGFFFLTAAGDPAKTGRGKWMLVFSAVGIAIAVIAKLMPSMVRAIMGL